VLVLVAAVAPLVSLTTSAAACAAARAASATAAVAAATAMACLLASKGVEELKWVLTAAGGGGGGGSDLFRGVGLRKAHLFLGDLESEGFLAPKIRRRKPIGEVKSWVEREVK